MRRANFLFRFFLLIAVLASGAALATASAVRKQEATTTWIGSWGTAQQMLESKHALPADLQRNVTLRQVVRLSIGGSAIRLRIANTYGTEPLHVTTLHVALPTSAASGQIHAASDRAVTFDERADVWVPAGAELTSDPVIFNAQPLALLAVTMQIEAMPAQQTGHPASHMTSCASTQSSVTASELESVRTIDHWYFLSAVDVSVRQAFAVVTFGDSITDGSGSTLNGNDRWPDRLAERLQQARPSRTVGVINAGIGGNRLLLDGTGQNALARFDRDVLARNGVRDLVVLLGINDLGMLTRNGAVPAVQHEELVRRMIQAYREMIDRAHAHGIRIIGGTLLPFGGFEFYHPDAANELDRQAVNAWVRAPGHFDAVIDFDELMADPQQPDRLKAEYDSGDHIHPSPAGYRAMGEVIPLNVFR